MNFLIIDDDASVRTLLKKRLLQNWPDASIDILDPSTTSIPDDNFQWKKYTIILLDYDLGIDNLTGLDILSRIKHQKNSPAVIMVTGQGSEDIAIKAIRLGATDYLIKYDVVTERLYNIIEETLEQEGNKTEIKSISNAGRISSVVADKNKKSIEYLNEWKIPGYGCITEITRGYTSTILAENLQMKQKVILKVQKFKHTESASLMIKRFTRELNLLTEINHPNIIKVLDHGITEDCAYYAMEYYPEGDLAHKIKKKNITPREAVDYICQIAKGLNELHLHGIVHRDVKPSNILFKNKETVVIADLGIAKDLSSNEELTVHGEVLGTPYYMSIEQLNSDPVDKRSDIYSLGIMFYELLTYHLPFTGQSIIQVVYKHTYKKIPQLPDTIAVWQPIIEKMAAKKPEDRFQDITQVLDAIESVNA